MPDPDRGPLQGVPKYNPHLWSDVELRAIFVVRNRELTGLLERLRKSSPDRAPQHVLMVGQRGMGKTTLLRRVALAVRDDPELAARWIALTFPEEQFTVSTLAELWSNVLDALTDALESEGAPPAALHRLDGEIQQLQALPPLEREAAAASLLDFWIAEHQRRILLLIDSTDLLFAGLRGAEESKRGSKTDADALWRLRKTLTHHSGFFWLGASYHTLESGHRYSDAFHDFFELLELRPLSLSEMREAMLALAHTFGAAQEAPGEAAAQAMARILDANPERLKALRNLSGGNPRTTVILYELFAADRQDNLHADLKLLLDLMTPLYKARMENLADQPRKLLAHLMEHWSPIALAELVGVSGIPSTTISGQLNRLETEGFIEKVKLPGRRRAGYQVAERFFNIWYLMRYSSRRARQRLVFLIEFMRLWYSTDELRTLATQRAQAHRKGQLCYADDLQHSRALAAALEEDLPERHRLDLSVFTAAQQQAQKSRRSIVQTFPDLFDLEDSDQSFSNAEDYQRRFAALDEALARCPHLTPQTKQAWVNSVKSSPSLSLAQKERVAKNSSDLSQFQYSALIEVFEDERIEWVKMLGLEAQRKIYTSILNGDFFPECSDADLAYKQVLAHFSDDAIALTWCGELLASSPAKHLVKKIYDRATKVDPKYASPWNGLGNLLQYRLGRYAEAETAYRAAIERDPKEVYPIANYANLLAFLHKQDQASEAYRQAASLATPLTRPDQLQNWEVLLQAHLWLGNQDSARQALEVLAGLASSGDQYALYKLREQAYECRRIGLGIALAELMEQSTYAGFLKPITLALRAATGQADALEGIPPEMQSMAQEVLQSILGQPQKAAAA